MNELPFRCPRLRANYFSARACQNNLALAREKEASGAQYIGILHHCLECQGKELQHSGTESQEVKSDMAAYGMCKYHPKTKAKVNRQGNSMGLCPQCLQDRPKREGAFAPKELPPAPAPEGAPDQTGAPLPPDGNQSGPATVTGMVEKVLGPGLAKTLLGDPEADQTQVPNALDLTGNPAKAKEEIMPVIKLSVAEAEKALGKDRVAAILGDPAEDEVRAPEARALYADGPAPVCKNHPETPAPAKIDSQGRNMGLCVACLKIRGRANGIKNQKMGLCSPPVSIPLNMPKYAELKQWLQAEADEHEGTLIQQVMYRLKLAWREATGNGQKAGVVPERSG